MDDTSFQSVWQIFDNRVTTMFFYIVYHSVYSVGDNNQSQREIDPMYIYPPRDVYPGS